jgi:hypothetical protein
MSQMGRYCCKKIFLTWNEEPLSRIKLELRILSHRTGHSESIIVECFWSNRFAGTFATVSAKINHALLIPRQAQPHTVGHGPTVIRA